MTRTNYAVAPGEYLEEWILEQGLSQQQVAGLLGCSRKQVNEIVNGHAPHHRRHCFPAGERGRHPRRLVASL
ncbi:helix-turn-helix transcriptional regulator [Arachnia rubra]|uniref:Helix-turn-helix transcriptional regulator n=1 Tax=Arachnia rubra TaxID=1547448 RepID=A0ABX7Y8H5_9ACTN|nr:helix-turn-helix transcriptional regulator [Arachnia rubra]BCR80261.1 hypothetical protein SK1NUM_07040 [Arachnia rubra]